MVFSKKIYPLSVFFILYAFFVQAQDKPVGYWESHLPYNDALALATDGKVLYTIGTQAFFTYDPGGNNQPVPYSKVEGMSDIGMQQIGYDDATATVILVYANGNIDLFKNNTFYNIPDLKIKTISGSKTIFQIYTENGTAYLSSALGILALDITNQTLATYQFSLNNLAIPVNSFTGNKNYFYAATGIGLFRIPKNSSQIQNFMAWEQVDSNTYTNITNVNGSLFLSTSNSVYTYANGFLQLLYSVYDTTHHTTLKHIDAGLSRLFISEYDDSTFTGHIKTMDLSYNLLDSFVYVGNPAQVVQRPDSSIWIADRFFGLMKKTPSKPLDSLSTPARYIPIGPNSQTSFDIYANNKKIWVAHGGYDDKYFATNSQSGISNLANGKWKVYPGSSFTSASDNLSTMKDFIALANDETNGVLYAASYLNGLLTMKEDGSSYQITDLNSVFEPTFQLSNGAAARQLVGLALDNSTGNLWVSQIQTPHQLFAKTPDGTWYKFTAPGVINGGPLVIDDNGQIWFISINSDNGGGVAVYNTNGTLNDPTDDVSYHLTTGVGSGNLPSNNVLCIAKDKNNDIWVGTDNGIAIISNCYISKQSQGCDANIPIVQYDQYAGYLFAGSSVLTIAVDGANRKWVGTDEGIWLLSSDASKIIYRFTVDNSPLPSNSVQKISIDKVTGDVYIGTDMGLISFHGTATEGGTSNQNVQVFPNPVKSGFTGTIAIKGLAANADVRITDIDGQLVFRTTALGGQAVWNGLDYKGHRPQTGVYLFFVSSSDGSQTYSGKIIFTQ